MKQLSLTGRLAAAMVCILALVSCQSKGTGPQGSVVIWSAEDGHLSGPAVESGGWTYFLWQAMGASDAPAQLRRLKAGDQPEDLKVAGADCPAPFFTRLRILPGGSLGAIQHCRGEETSLVSIDLSQRVATKVLAISAATDVALGVGTDDGWLEFTQGGCSAIAPLEKGQRRKPAVLEPAVLLGWEIDGGFGAKECAQFGQAGFPRPAEGNITFALASPESRGVDPGLLGKGRAGLTWRVYRMDLAVGRIGLVGGSFTLPTAMVLVGPATRAVVAAQSDGHPGVWSIDLSNGSVTNVADGSFTALSLAQDGSVLATERLQGSEKDRKAVDWLGRGRCVTCLALRLITDRH